jgi:RND family efflux transporter MFP subunit
MGYGLMLLPRPWPFLLVALCLVWFLNTPLYAENEKEWQPSAQTPSAEPPLEPTGSLTRDKSSINIEAAVINPYRSAAVGAQVSGMIERFAAEEGDLVNEGQAVVEIAERRYRLLVDRAKEKLLSLQAAAKRADEDAKLKEEVFELDATTRQELLRAASEAEVARHRLGEAQKELDLAVFDLDACRVKAPFTGYLAAKLKQPDEPVERLEKIFTLVDTSKVYAVANVPEEVLVHFPRDAEAVFVNSAGKVYKGEIDRVGKIIDPKSRTKRVHVLIDNPRTELEVGMSGSLRLSK